MIKHTLSTGDEHRPPVHEFCPLYPSLCSGPDITLPTPRFRDDKFSYSVRTMLSTPSSSSAATAGGSKAHGQESGRGSSNRASKHQYEDAGAAADGSAREGGCMTAGTGRGHRLACRHRRRQGGPRLTWRGAATVRRQYRYAALRAVNAPSASVI